MSTRVHPDKYVSLKRKFKKPAKKRKKKTGYDGSKPLKEYAKKLSAEARRG